jgi:hypothetical protein
MSKLRSLALGSALIFVAASPALAQTPAPAPAAKAATTEKPAAEKPAAEKRASPHEQASITIAGKKVTIDYGRPFKKGREIFGGLVPWNEVWRAGADEATTLTTEADLTIGTLQVPKGTYTLFLLPTQKGWTLIVNKVAKQWGAYSYDAKKDLGRVPMKVAPSATPAEQFTITLEAQGTSGANLKMAWDKTVGSVALTAR